jgi:hypothetical protein
MFSYIFKNLNILDLPFVYAKINLFFFLHTQVFKNKFSNQIMYFIEHMASLRFKKVQVFFAKKDYELFYIYFVRHILVLSILLLLFI